MASVVTEKLYPPVIGSSIPAFYEENGTAVIAVPFAMNRAVTSDMISGFVLKIKTVQSNTYLKSLETSDTIGAISNRIIKFYWEDFNNDSAVKKIKIGQYLKIQIAYKQAGSDVTGYFSTVGIIKYTSKPRVYIEGMSGNTNRIDSFKMSYTGVYETTADKSERPYSYNFFLYDKNKGLIETTGWKLHNTSINNIASESLSLSRTTDTYVFESVLELNQDYFIQYGVRTINNLEIYSPLYTCNEPEVSESVFKIRILAENNYEEAYVQVKLQKLTFTQEENDAYLLNKYGGNFVYSMSNNTVKAIYQLTSAQLSEVAAEHFEFLSNIDPIVVLSLQNTLPSKGVSIQVCRAEKTDNFSTWRLLKKAYFRSYDAAEDWVFRDFTIEQGVIYKYCFRQYNDLEIASTRTESNSVMADFEDMFLWDGEKQLKIRFNPKVSSFKANRLETKIDTIGSRYPFIFRNGVVEYKEFPISGLISYLADNNEMFMHHEEDLNIVLGPNASRPERATPVDQSQDDTSIGKSWEISQTLDSIGYNMRAERRFKMKLLEWLGDGKIKMFKSAAEGNFLVRLLNIQLTPEDRVGRMLHNFSCTAYEIEELSYENLLDLKFIRVDEPEVLNEAREGVLFSDKILETVNFNNSIKINNYSIYQYLNIQLSTQTSGGPFFIRLGADNPDNRVLIQPGFIINTPDPELALPDVWLNANDNISLLGQDGVDYSSGIAKRNFLLELVGNAVLNYKYLVAVIQTGEFENIEDVYIKNKVCTHLGPYEQSFLVDNVSYASSGSLIEQILKFYVIDFSHKKVSKVYTPDNTNYYLNGSTPVQHFDDTSVYQIYDDPSCTEDYLIRICACSNGALSNSNSVTIANPIKIKKLNDGTYVDFTDPTYTIAAFETGRIYFIYGTNNKLLSVCRYSKSRRPTSFDSTRNLLVYNSNAYALQTVIDTSIVLVDQYNHVSYFEIIPNLNLNEEIYKKIKIGFGVQLDCAYQAKYTKYKNA